MQMIAECGGVLLAVMGFQLQNDGIYDQYLLQQNDEAYFL